jgi:mono/diheme cytochrome c family protein
MAKAHWSQEFLLMVRSGSSARCWVLVLFLAGGLVGLDWAQQPSRQAPSSEARYERATVQQFVTQHCSSCHDRDVKKAGLDLDALSSEDVAAHPEVWEKVARKLGARQMPPAGKRRPDERTYLSIVTALEAELDRVAATRPDPGRTPTLRRLNRTEYQNAIHDLLALDIDAATLLPADEANHGFDSAPLGDLSPTLLDRYITAAQKISRLAVGRAPKTPNSDTFRVPPDQTQEGHVEGLPLGTRGGTRIPYTFPQDGEYDIQAWLTRDRNEQVEGLRQPHELLVLLDRKHMASLTVKPSVKNEVEEKVDAKLKARIAVTAGPHDLGVTFVQNTASLLETKRQPYQAHYNLHRHPRETPAIFQVSITGPYNANGHGDTPSRRRIFICNPAGPADEADCAKKIVSALLRRAYRRPVAEADVDKAMKFYRQGRADGDFEAGIEMALSAVVVNPQFIFRVEQEPAGLAAKAAYRVSDLDLASRLSFFLWSTIPDDELLDLAERNELHKPEVFEKQVRRLLADSRSRNLATNFAAQWLHLRNLESITPDLRLFPDFDDNLRQGFRQETELFVESVLREDRSALDLLRADYTFVNERLAMHYGIPHVYGNRFRRVALGADRERGGLLRQGSILTVTSYATRTSPVIRGKWILENFLGTPPPPPPGNVPSLSENTVAANLPIRERLAEHRTNTACASCHRLIDPVGFSLEQFDAVGRWRVMEEGKPVDAAGGLPDGSEFTGVSGLEQALLQRQELFVRTLTEKLFTFALGRAPEESDAPAIRKIVRDARADDYRFSSLIVGLASSTPFQMRKSQ